MKTFIAITILVSCLVTVANGWCLPATATTTKTIATTTRAIVVSTAFDPSVTRAGIPSKGRVPSTVLSLSASAAEDVSGMRLSEIKSELKDRNINFSDCFDKESMVAKLAEARADNIDNSIDKNSDDGEEESPPPPSSSSPATFDRDKALEELKGMRVRELREELGKRRISRAGLFEKEDLVNALLEARAIASIYSGTGLLTPGEVSDLSSKDVQTEIDHPGSLLLLDVYATWCGPCQMIAPILQEIAADEGDQLRVVKMDSDQNQELSSKLKVSGLPTLVLFQGCNEIDRIEGAPTKEQLMGWIDSRR